VIGTCAAYISCNLMVALQIGRIIIELPLRGKCRSILNFYRKLRANSEEICLVYSTEILSNTATFREVNST